MIAYSWESPSQLLLTTSLFGESPAFTFSVQSTLRHRVELGPTRYFRLPPLAQNLRSTWHAVVPGIFTQRRSHAKTFLECTKGSTLDVLINQDIPVPVMALLLSHAQRNKHLEFQTTLWEDIEMFSLATSRSLPLLRTLKITPGIEDEQLVTISPLSPPPLAAQSIWKNSPLTRPRSDS